MKSFAQKLLAFTLLIAFATGCASSVTDAGLEQPEQPETEQVTIDQPDNIDFGSDVTMDPIYDKPE